MKRLILIFATLAAIMSCNRDQDRIDDHKVVPMHFAAYIESSETETKTVLGGNPDDTVRRALWCPSDSIYVTNGTSSSKFINTETTVTETAQFDGLIAVGETYYSAYPYQAVSGFSSSEFVLNLPSEQPYYEGGITPDYYPMVAQCSDGVFDFKNLCGILVLKLMGTGTVTSVTFSGKDSGGKNLPVAGKCKVSMDYSSTPTIIMDSESKTPVTLNCPQGVSLNPATPKTFHIVLPPATYETFTVAITDNNGNTMFLNGKKPLTVKRSCRVVAKSVDFYPGEATDLSASGTANCYVVSQAGKYKFKATVKGGTSESVGTPFSAEILWESFGTDIIPAKGDVVQNASYSDSDGYVTFNTRSSLNDGNAVIAVKDASGTILWSWHIWVCNVFNPETSVQKYNNNAGTMMDRNLGATSATPGDVHALGLLYQWGRKDPFLGSLSISGDTKAASTGDWPSPAVSTSETGTLDYVEKNPMQFITQNESNHDWYYTGSSATDNTRWQTSGKTKGVYDPCPAGWCVPNGGPVDSLGIWSKAFGSSSSFENGPWDGTSRGMNFGNGAGTGQVLGNYGTIWYPAAGYLDCTDASLVDVGSSGGYWSRTPTDGLAYFLYILSGGTVSPSSTYYAYRSYAQSVRCVLESSIPVVTPPRVTTSLVSSITESTATCGGNVTDDGGAYVTARGVVWGTSEKPTIESCSGMTTDGSGKGKFTSSLTDLSPSTTYYVRSYAKNSAGISYGEQMSFTSQFPGAATDLSSGGTANCYVVSQAGKYKFKATVKGGTSESIGTPSVAEVLWESFGTDVTPEVGKIVTGASYSDGYITFSTPSPLNNGNSVIAVKDASGNILWSWHLWVCSGYDPKASAQVYNNDAGTMMDRNLGATSATKGDVCALGLLYQWGRKDPFLGSSSISSGTKAKSTGNWPSAVSSTSQTGTFSYVEKNPMQFIKYNNGNWDWYHTGSSSTDNTRWQTSENAKGKYDPCPPGWRVPDGGDSGIWSTAFGRSTYWKNISNWDGAKRGMDFGETDSTLIKRGSGQCWYPAAGYLDCIDASLDEAGAQGGYWSCTPSGYYAYFLYIINDGTVSPSSTYYAYRSYAQSVRCVLESSIPSSGSAEGYGNKEYDW